MRVFKTYILLGLISAALAGASLSMLNPGKVFAQYYAPEEERRSLLIDKKISDLGEFKYLDNIDPSMKVFVEDDLIEYSIEIENKSNVALENIKITDRLPENIKLLFHPGTFNKSSRTIEWEISKLEAGEKTKPFLIRGKISDTQSLAISTNTKRINKVEARAGEVTDQDTASYFIVRKGVPKTGDNSLMLRTYLVLGSVIGGIGIRKIIRGF